MCKKKESAKGIVDDIMDGAERLLKGASNLIA